mgnify:CR=1 FL=1
MKFNCKEITVSDEELGCTITFSEKIDNGEIDLKQSVDELLKSMGKYLTLQKTYPEDEFEEDYCYFEASDFENTVELQASEINLTRKSFKLTFENEKFEVTNNPSEKQYQELKTAIKIIIGETGKVNIEE